MISIVLKLAIPISNRVNMFVDIVRII